MNVMTLTALSVALALSACGASSEGKESGGIVALRAVLAFKACTAKLEDQFGLKKVSGVSSSDMDPVPTGKPGEWDVKFTADVTEKGSGRVTRYKGVCHVRRDRPTTLDASFVKEIKAAAGQTGVVRRVAP
jgi:hypothetical protein